MIEINSKNKEILEQYKTELESLPLWKSVKDIDKSDVTSEQYCMKQTSINITECFEMLEEGVSITTQLEEIKMDTEDYWYNEQNAKPILDIFKQFKFRNYRKELSVIIKENVGWRKKDRDLKIYNEHKKGKTLGEIINEMNLNLTVPAVQMIKKKVESSINTLKGRLFEIEYEKYLRSLNKFRNSKVIRNGKPGKPDIYIVKGKDLFVLSLKNLELKKNSHTIIVKKLRPELDFAYSSACKGYNVTLYLIVFDSIAEKIHVKELDYKNPSNIIIHR